MIAQFARFDIGSWLPRKQTLLPLAFVVIVGIVLPMPGMAIVAAAFVASLMISAPFLGDERGRLDTLYGVLPVSRRSVVVGRAISILVYYVITAVIATAVTYAAALIRGTSIAADVVIIAHAAAFAFVGLSLSLQLPVLFRLGYSRGRLMAYAPSIVIAGALWLAQATGFADTIQIEDGEISVGVVAAVGALMGTAGVLVGSMVAIRTYRSRDLG